MPHTDSATVDAQVPSNPHVVRYTGLPATWCDGLLLGNGEIGVRCWSDDKKLKFTLDSASAWDLRLEDGWLERCGFTYAELCELVGKRDFDALKKASKRGRSVYGVGPTKTPPTEVGHQAARRSRVSTARVKFLR